MKTTYLISSLLALLTLGSCIAPQDEEIDCQDCSEQQIAIRLASDNATTRAGRPLYSNQPQQDVDRVMLIFCAGNQIVSTKLIKDWMSDEVSEIYENNDGNHGRQAVVKLEGEDRLDASTAYTVYAIAYTYDESDENHRTAYTVNNQNLNDYLEDLRTGTESPENLALTLTEAPGEEIFAGSASFTTSDSGGFYEQLVLNRQVAGVYMYVSAIPNINQAKELRLTAAADNDELVLGQFDNKDYGQDSEKGNKVVNGTTSKTTADANGRYTLCSITFNDWKDEDGNWKNHYTDAKFEKDSYFSGSFVIPFAAQKDVQSLKMELIGDNGTIKEWNVNLPENDISTEIYTWSDNAFSINSNITESPTSYCLLRNHLYCIGSKGTDSGEDNPQPLDTGQDIQLKVIAEWDYVYDIMLEPTPGGSK